MELSDRQRDALTALLAALIDQQQAAVLVEPYRRETGFWFGGGGLVRDADGALWLNGRYRNYGDSRTGLAAGERGLECALFSSQDGGRTFLKRQSWTKEDLSTPEATVLSIEGTSLHLRDDGQWELFISSEKAWEYPDSVKEFRKPGAGVWSVDVIHGASLPDLPTDTLRPVLREEQDVAYLHIKDPVVYDAPDGSTHMIYCSHPYCWSCANTGLAVRQKGQGDFRVAAKQLVPRGSTWDVAGTRVTCRMPIPRTGVFADAPAASVLFYDGLECVRQHDENRRAVSRPRGYSCEEISGALAGFDVDFPAFERLSYINPLFISPYGTGCSRYTDVLVGDEGLFACWQQGQDDLSQPFVGHFLPMSEVEALLS